ncbi:MAG TPA: nucleoside triphosphate pyrophosphohydrolase [Methylocella sp.]|nr:nucleoside triphosphate pyrophosphohydrolase [Methylocella sp.]
MQPSRDPSRVVEIMAALRTPGTGCAWDLEQTFETIVPYTIEESYEIADAVARGDMNDLKEELGDLLLQVVFQARIAEELGLFDFGGVVEAITQKLIRRHPHVFGAVRDLSPDEVNALWETIKREEKSLKGGAESPSRQSILADIPLALPGLTRAIKLQAKASTVGFDWKEARLVLAKIREETDEIEAALDAGETAAIVDEIGDLLFSAANLARHANADPEAAIRQANAKFERRFRFIEMALAGDGRAPGAATLAAMEELWNLAKQDEKHETDIHLIVDQKHPE